jgi:hypothetical protein
MSLDHTVHFNVLGICLAAPLRLHDHTGAPPAAASRASRILRRSAIAINAGLAVGFVGAFVKYVATPGAMEASDFSVFWTGWSLVLHGPVSGLYDVAAQRLTQQRLLGGGHFEGGLMSFVNPPHAALASAPLGWLADHLGEQAAFAIWACANLAVLALLVRAVWHEWGAVAREPRFVLASALVGFYPVYCALKNGQTSILLALAVLGVYRAARDERPWAGAGWLTVLTIKPQLVPMLIIYLAVRHHWRMIACAAVLISATVAITAVVLGPMVWVDYLTKIHALELYWGTGTPVYMMNVRGVLTRIVGLSAHSTIDAFSKAVWAAAMAFTGVVLVVRGTGRAADPRPAYAFAIAISLLTNPHLFIHDTIIWAIPLLLCAAARRDAGLSWQPIVQLALAWPLVFFIAGSLLNRNAGRLIWLDPEMALLVGTAAFIVIGWPAARVRRMPAEAFRLDAVVSGFGRTVASRSALPASAKAMAGPP